MRIAVLSPIAWRTPPRSYGPWEQIASLVTEGLVRRGHEVTLFATGDSITSAKLHSVCPRPYEEDKDIDPKVWECIHISAAFERADDFDIIHSHYDFLPLGFSNIIETPIVTTIHGFSSPKIIPAFKRYNNRVFYISISEADRSTELDYAATVYNGVDLSQFTLNEHPKDYLLFFGRIHHDKGLREAIEIAKRSGRELRIAGVIQDGEYYKNEIEPHIDGKQITYHGPVGPDLRNFLLGNAYALLHPINFAEPFGLSVVEAMACGTPVIAFNRGSMPELISHGENGFLVDDVKGALYDLGRIPEVSRMRCREIAEERFSSDRMVDDYVRVYESVLSKCERENHRPWGFYEVLSERPGHKVKRITVYPGKRLSLQRHWRRREHWYIIQGEALVTLNDMNYRFEEDEAVDIPFAAPHRVQNPGEKDLVFIEVQQGEYLGEDDIERLEDDYGRVGRE